MHETQPRVEEQVDGHFANPSSGHRLLSRLSHVGRNSRLDTQQRRSRQWRKRRAFHYEAGIEGFVFPKSGEMGGQHVLDSHTVAREFVEPGGDPFNVRIYDGYDEILSRREVQEDGAMSHTGSFGDVNRAGGVDA